MPDRDREIIERLTRIEENLKGQGVTITEIKNDIKSLREELNVRIKENGMQDRNIALLDQRVSCLEGKHKLHDWRVWSALIAALAALAQGFTEWFFRK